MQDQEPQRQRAYVPRLPKALSGPVGRRQATPEAGGEAGEEEAGQIGLGVLPLVRQSGVRSTHRQLPVLPNPGPPTVLRGRRPWPEIQREQKRAGPRRQTSVRSLTRILKEAGLQFGVQLWVARGVVPNTPTPETVGFGVCFGDARAIPGRRARLGMQRACP